MIKSKWFLNIAIEFPFNTPITWEYCDYQESRGIFLTILNRFILTKASSCSSPITKIQTLQTTKLDTTMACTLSQLLTQAYSVLNATNSTQLRVSLPLSALHYLSTRSIHGYYHKMGPHYPLSDTHLHKNT